MKIAKLAIFCTNIVLSYMGSWFGCYYDVAMVVMEVSREKLRIFFKLKLDVAWAIDLTHPLMYFVFVCLCVILFFFCAFPFLRSYEQKVRVSQPLSVAFPAPS